jgi:hypothetical protein
MLISLEMTFSSGAKTYLDDSRRNTYGEVLGGKFESMISTQKAIYVSDLLEYKILRQKLAQSLQPCMIRFSPTDY